jgi:5-methyltetrahydrofolate--homocysteine methyltransferase
VILGGAALNRRYVEHDLRSLYKGQLYYGEDAFEGLRVMDELAARKKLERVGSPTLRGVVQSARSVRVREGNLESTDHRDLVSQVGPGSTSNRNGEALPPRAPNLLRSSDVPHPPFLGSRVRTDFDLREVFRYLNEITLFGTQWGFRKGGVKPAEHARQIAETARPALERLKQLCLDQQILRPGATYGFFPAASDGTKLTIFEDDHRTSRAVFDFPRQDSGEFLCLADYVEPAREGKAVDYVAFMAVTMGREVTKVAHEWYTAGRYQDYLYLHGLGVESAEALAEMFHKELRAEWGIGGEDSPQIQKLFKGHYRGCRYSFGYPACPNLDDQAPLFSLIDPTRVGITLSDQFQLEPEQSTTAIVMHHPKAKYFNVGRYTDCAMKD